LSVADALQPPLPYFPKNRLGGMPTVRVTMALKALALA
jgi:hypothetical protein